MTGFTVLGGVIIFFLFFIYVTWFGTQLKIEAQKKKSPSIKINPYDNLPLSRRFIDKKNNEPFFTNKIKIRSWEKKNRETL